MTAFRFFLFLTFCASLGLAQNIQEKHVHYKIKSGDTLSKILRRVQLYPIWTANGSLEATVKLNLKAPYLIKDRDNLEPGSIIRLPIVAGNPTYKYNRQGHLILPNISVAQYPAKSKRRKRRPASNQDRDIQNFQISFGCQQAKDSEVFQNIGRVLGELDKKIENLTIAFQCGKYVSEEKPIARQPTHIKKEFKVPPWMLSFADETTLAGGSASLTEQKTSFFFPSLGYNSIDYSEGNLENSFTNAYAALRYRQIISKPYWHFDAEAKFGAASLSNDLQDSKAQILDVDLRVGRGFQLFDEPWHFTLFAGAFYTQMFVSDDQYGYKGLYYPQLYPELRRLFNSGNSMSFSAKFVPTGNSFLEFSDDLAVSLGFQYNIRISDFDSFFNLNHSRLKYKASGAIQVELNQTSVGFGVGF